MSEHSSAMNETYVNARGVFVWVAGTIVLLAIILVGLRAFFAQYSHRELDAKVYALPSEALQASQQRWSAELSSYKAIDKAAGVYQVPVAVARDLVIKDYQQRKAELAAAAAMPVDPAAAPVEGEVPAGGEAPAGGQAPAGAEQK